MVAKAIVKEVIDEGRAAKVIIPMFENADDFEDYIYSEGSDTQNIYVSGAKDKTDEKNASRLEAPVCTLLNCKLDLKVGDHVYVAFENGHIETPVIIGLVNNPKKGNEHIPTIKVKDVTAENVSATSIKTSKIESSNNESIEVKDLTVSDSLTLPNDFILPNNIKIKDAGGFDISLSEQFGGLKEPIILTSGTSFGSSFPEEAANGQLFFLIEEDMQQ